MIPRLGGVSIKLNATNWRVFYLGRPVPPRSFQATWAARTGAIQLNHKECLQQVLKWVWNIHTELTEEPCPFNIDTDM